MSDNTSQRKALQQLESESDYDRITYYQKPFMVLWAAVQEASSELQDDYALSPELAQLWVAEQAVTGLYDPSGPAWASPYGSPGFGRPMPEPDQSSAVPMWRDGGPALS